MTNAGEHRGALPQQGATGALEAAPTAGGDMGSPMFSVIVPVFNRASLIGRTIESVLGQSFGNYEIIVADDGSTDGTAEVARKFGPHVRVFTQPNKGECGARNLGMEHARGEYLVFLDSDDLLMPWALETFAEVIGAHHRPSLVFGSDRSFAEQERATLAATQRASLREEAFGCLFEAPRFSCRSIVCNALRADVARIVGKFHEAHLNALDIDYTIRCAAARGFVKIYEPLTSVIYQHDMNISRNTRMNLGGVEHLIREEKAGRYPGGEQLRAARRALVCFHARIQSVRAAQAGEAGAAWRVYRQVFWWALRLGHWRYALGMPMTVAAGMLRGRRRKGVG